MLPGKEPQGKRESDGIVSFELFTISVIVGIAEGIVNSMFSPS